MDTNFRFWTNRIWKKNVIKYFLKNIYVINFLELEIPYEQKLIILDDNTYINTIKVGKGPPLVLLHGFGAGIGIWVG